MSWPPRDLNPLHRQAFDWGYQDRTVPPMIRGARAYTLQQSPHSMILHNYFQQGVAMRRIHDANLRHHGHTGPIHRWEDPIL